MAKYLLIDRKIEMPNTKYFIQYLCIFFKLKLIYTHPTTSAISLVTDFIYSFSKVF